MSTRARVPPGAEAEIALRLLCGMSKLQGRQGAACGDTAGCGHCGAWRGGRRVAAGTRDVLGAGCCGDEAEFLWWHDGLPHLDGAIVVVRTF